MLITADRVLAGAGLSAVAGGAVLVRDGLIDRVGTREDVQAHATEGEPRLDLAGATLLPGLVDAHVHLCFDAGPDPVAVLQGQDDEELYAAMRTRAGQLLSHGITTARDLGDRGGLALRLAGQVAAGEVAGPRIVSAGAPATPPGGHCWFLGGEVSGPDEIRALVRRNSAAGAAVVKVMETGGGLTEGGAQSWESQFSTGELAAAVDEAHRAGLPVAAHAHGTDGIAAAVEAGVDTIEHCTWMTPTGFEVREDVLERLLDRGIRVCPTIGQHWRRLPQVFGEERAEAMFAAVRRMAGAGVRLIAGTDAGVQRSGFGALPDSLTFYEHLGVPTGRILAMATTDAADALGLGARTGQLTPGHSADLLAVDGDPRTDLAALKSVRAVFAAGRQV